MTASIDAETTISQGFGKPLDQSSVCFGRWRGSERGLRWREVSRREGWLFRDTRASLIEDGTNEVLSLAGARRILVNDAN